LGLEVEVKSFRESVQLDLARREESVWSGGGFHSEWKGGSGGEFSASEKSSKVTIKKILLVMRRIVGVDKRRVRLGVIIIFIIILLDLSSSIHILVLSRGLSSARDMVTSDDSESVDSSGVLDSVGLAIIPDVTVLSDPLIVPPALLPVHHPILLGESRSKLSSSSIESLLLQDPGIAGISLELRSRESGACKHGN